MADSRWQQSRRLMRHVVVMVVVLIAAARLSNGATTAQTDVDRIVDACGSLNPYFAVTRFAANLPETDPHREPAIVAFRDTPGDDATQQITLTTQAEVGATYGLAYDPSRRQLYSAAVGSFWLTDLVSYSTFAPQEHIRAYAM